MKIKVYGVIRVEKYHRDSLESELFVSKKEAEEEFSKLKKEYRYAEFEIDTFILNTKR